MKYKKTKSISIFVLIIIGIILYFIMGDTLKMTTYRSVPIGDICYGTALRYYPDKCEYHDDISIFCIKRDFGGLYGGCDYRNTPTPYDDRLGKKITLGLECNDNSDCNPGEYCYDPLPKIDKSKYNQCKLIDNNIQDNNPQSEQQQGNRDDQENPLNLLKGFLSSLYNKIIGWFK